MRTRQFCLLSAAILFGILIAAAAQAQNKALDPVDRKNDWWVKRQAENVDKMNQGNIELLLIGDSITQGWDGQQELYEQFFGAYKPINLGFSGDQTQHVLWRLDNLPLDKISPKVAMIMIGTNNIGHSDRTTPKETAQGITAIVRKLQQQYPRLQIIVLKVFPRDEKPDGELRNKVNEINAALPGLLRGMRNVYLADINAGFLDKDGTLPKSIMEDFLHPDREGYEYWGKSVSPYIEAAFQKFDRQSRRTVPPRMFPAGNRLRALLR